MADLRRGQSLSPAQFRKRLAVTLVVLMFVLVLSVVSTAALLAARGLSPWGMWGAVGTVCTFAGFVLRRILSHYFPLPGRQRKKPAS